MTGHMRANVKFGVTSMHKKCFQGIFAIYFSIETSKLRSFTLQFLLCSSDFAHTGILMFKNPASFVGKQQGERKKNQFFALPFRQVVKTPKNRLL